MVFISVALASRYLGAEGKGLTSLITTNLLFICLANEFVGGVSLIYLIPRRQPMALLIPAFIFTLIDSLLLTSFFHFLEIVPKEYSVHLYFLAVLQTLNNTVLYVLLGNESVKRHNYLFLLKAVVNALLLGVFFIWLKNATVEAFLHALYLSNLIPLLIGAVLLIPFLRRNPKTGNIISATRDMLSYSGFAQSANIIQTLNYRLSFYLLNVFIGPKAVGVYSVALALCDVIWMMSKSIGTVQLARISNLNDSGQAREMTKMFLRFSVAGALLLLIPVMLTPERIYTLVFGSEFGETRNVMLLLGGGVLVFSINIILANHFAGTGRYKINMIASLIGLVVNATANVLLIPRFGLSGAAIAASITYCVIVVYTWLRFARESDIGWRDLVADGNDWKKVKEAMGWGRN